MEEPCMLCDGNRLTRWMLERGSLVLERQWLVLPFEASEALEIYPKATLLEESPSFIKSLTLIICQVAFTIDPSPILVPRSMGEWATFDVEIHKPYWVYPPR